MNTMLDESLPLTTEEWIEWGNPNEKKAWDYMVQYSPYDNVKAQKYPNMLIEISLNDSQVPYWEGAKLAAKIREMKTDDNVVLLKANMGAGHGGSSGRYDRLKEVAFDYDTRQRGRNRKITVDLVYSFDKRPRCKPRPLFFVQIERRSVQTDGQFDHELCRKLAQCVCNSSDQKSYLHKAI